jgi:cytochrome P450
VPGGAATPTKNAGDAELSLYRLLAPEVRADPYPLYHRLRAEDPVHWDPFLHTWVVTAHEHVMTVLQDFSAARTPSPELLESLGMGELTPVARVMVRQMLYMDPPDHTRIRMIVAKGFAPLRVDALRERITTIVDELLTGAARGDGFDVIADFARPLPAIVSCEMLGLPAADWPRLSEWTRAFSELLGNFQHGPVRAARLRGTVTAITEYFERALRERASRPAGLLDAFVGDGLSDDEAVANAIITLVGGLETTTNLIGNGLLALLRRPDQWARVRDEPACIPGAVEELLRYDSPIQHTARVAATDATLGGRHIARRQAVIAVLAAANRDPAAFPDPDRLDIARAGNRHLAFGWSTHHCFGAPLARLVAQIAFAALATRLGPAVAPPVDVVWRADAGAFRGLESLPVPLR